MSTENVQPAPTQSFLYQKTLWKLLFNLPGLVSAIIIGAILIGAGLFIAPQGNFLAGPNFNNLIRFWSLHAMLVPATLLILTGGGIDLSIGAIMTASAILVASLAPFLGMPVAAGIGLLMALLIGLINGLIVGATRLNGAFVTLGMAILLRGLITLFTQGKLITVADPGFLADPTLPWIGLAAALVLGIPLIIVCQFRKAAQQPDREERWGTRLFYVASPYLLSGLMAGLAGLIYLGFLRVAMPTLGTGFEIDALLIAILGGVPLGNLGMAMSPVNLIGGLLAAAALALLQNVMALMNGSTALIDVIKGVGIVGGGGVSYLYYFLVGRIRSRKTYP